MRIAIYQNQPSGGAKRTLYEIARRLALMHDVDVFTLSSADEAFLDSRDYARNVVVQPYQQRPQPRLGFYLNDWRSYRDLVELNEVNRQVAIAINGGGYDVVYADACRYLQSPFLLRYLTAPSAFFCHEPPRRYSEPMCRPSAAPLPPFERTRLIWRWPTHSLLEGYRQAADRQNVRAAGLILTNSRHTQAKVRQAYHRSSEVCPLGVDSSFFSPGRGESGSYVLSVGALEPHKGFEFVVRSLGRVAPSLRPELKLVCNTDHPVLRRHLERVAHRLDVKLSIHLRVSQAELLALYQGARLFVYAPYNEPFGLAALEAMACSVPVVAVGEGGVLESVQDGVTGLLTPRLQERFAEAVTMLLHDEATRLRLARAAREFAEERSWKRTAQHVETLLTGLVRQGRVAEKIPVRRSAGG